MDGVIDKEFAKQAMVQSVENEVYSLFLHYTTNSFMDVTAFINLLRDCRILSKQDFK